MGNKRWYEKARERMRSERMSYAELTKRLEIRGIAVGKSTVGAWMIGRNEPPVTTIIAIGDILGMSVSEMVGEDVFFVKDPVVRAIVQRLDSMTEAERIAVLKFLGAPSPDTDPQKT